MPKPAKRKPKLIPASPAHYQHDISCHALRSEDESSCTCGADRLTRQLRKREGRRLLAQIKAEAERRTKGTPGTRWELRLYVDGSKRFADFDATKFLAAIEATDWKPTSSETLVNPLIENAIAQATGNRAYGEPYTLAIMELQARPVKRKRKRQQA